MGRLCGCQSYPQVTGCRLHLAIEERKMQQLVEILRRAAQAVIWICGVGLTIALFVSGLSGDQTLMWGAAAVVALLTWFLSKLVNWIFGN